MNKTYHAIMATARSGKQMVIVMSDEEKKKDLHLFSRYYRLTECGTYDSEMDAEEAAAMRNEQLKRKGLYLMT